MWMMKLLPLLLVVIVCYDPLCVRSESNVGCLFSSRVCEQNEECFDDNAFGVCQMPFRPDRDLYRHLLGSETTKLLERELARLFAGGYRWRHQYTQCVVQNILHANRHRISYDPGLCSRVLQFSLPDVPEDLLSELQSPDPDELAYIKFNPSRDDPGNNKFADEIFTPPINGNHKIKNTEKRSPQTFSDDEGWVQTKFPEHIPAKSESPPRHAGRESLLRQLMEAAEDTEELIEQFGDQAESYPRDDLPIIKTDLSSDLNQKPAFTEGGTQWLPVSDDGQEYSIDDVIDPYSKKRVSLHQEREWDDDKPRVINLGPMGNDLSHNNDENFIVDSVDRDNSWITEEDSDDKDSDIVDYYKYTPLGEKTNFKWNNNHRNPNADDDLTKFAFGNKSHRKFIVKDEDSSEKNNLSDVIEDDYLEDQLYAILPMDSGMSTTNDDSGMSTFTRDMRYDIKKPGPTYMIHEDEDGDTSHDEDDMMSALLAHLSKAARQEQMLAMLRAHGGSEKSSNLLVPRHEVIEGAQRIVLTGGSDISVNKGKIAEQKDRIDDVDKGKQFERMRENQPELLEGIEDMSSSEVKDEDRTANAAQTGEGHIGHYDSVDATHTYLRIKEKVEKESDAQNLVDSLGKVLGLPRGSFSNVKMQGDQVTFKVNPNTKGYNASDVATKAEMYSGELKKMTGLTVETAGIGDEVKYEMVSPDNDRRLFILTFALCGGVAGILLAVAIAYLVRRHSRSRDKLHGLSQPDTEASQDYQDLCRQRMASKANEKPESVQSVHSPKRIRSLSQEGQASLSSHSSTSSWNEEPVTSNMDISTGHMILSYMEDHLKNKDRLDREWEALCAYEAELCSTTAATLPQNIKKNRYTDVLPYDHSRVLLTEVSNVSGSDYINASSITDHDPRNPAYIATQGPLPQTAADFWQMIWEQGSVVIVMLSRLMENGVAMCHRYWPEEGSEVYHIYEVHLVSEHIWCDDYLVRSFYLKNLRTNETRTVTQFHFMSWPDNGVPNSTKALLEFRRKVNKSYRGRSCPIVVHCSDGIGRTGTYCLIDMVLNRMAKGAKEIDIAATLEHVRDQRAGMVKTKAQFEFVLMAIAEEVHAILKALSQ